VQWGRNVLKNPSLLGCDAAWLLTFRKKPSPSSSGVQRSSLNGSKKTLKHQGETFLSKCGETHVTSQTTVILDYADIKTSKHLQEKFLEWDICQVTNKSERTLVFACRICAQITRYATCGSISLAAVMCWCSVYLEPTAATAPRWCE
jgi:hypothetical protein